MNSPISIIDYGMGNLRSVQKAFEAIGCPAGIIASAQEVRAAQSLVLPGVGAIGDALATIRSRGLERPILTHIASGRPFLGICLGLQMLFDVGYEDGEHRALGVFRGRCVRLDVDGSKRLKVPHMGWNQLRFRAASPLLAGLPDGCSVYFVHSYHVEPEDPGIVTTTTDYGGEFVSSIRKGNVLATQFHPEKSQSVGLRMLRNFAEMSRAPVR